MHQTLSPSPALSLLLAHERLMSLSGTEPSFGQPLSHYAQDLLQNLQHAGYPQEIHSRESFEVCLPHFNIGSLIQHLLGCPDHVHELVERTLRFVHRIAEQARMPEWHAFAIQPLINLARVARSLGDTAQCLSILASLHSVVVDENEGLLFDIPIELNVAHLIHEFNDKAVRVVDTCCCMEELKCALISRNLELIHTCCDTDKLDPQSSLYDFKLECLLKCELMDHAYDRLLSIVDTIPNRKLWPYIYVTDAFIEANLLKEAHELAMLLMHQWMKSEKPDNILVGYSVALRLAYLSNYSAANVTADKLLTISIGTGNEVMQLRAATLLAVLSSNSTNESFSEANERLWALIYNSRHNYERFTSCVAMSEALEADQEMQYFRAACYLAKHIPLQYMATRPATQVLERKTGTYSQQWLKQWMTSSTDASIDVACPEAEQLFHCLMEIATATRFRHS